MKLQAERMLAIVGEMALLAIFMMGIALAARVGAVYFAPVTDYIEYITITKTDPAEPYRLGSKLYGRSVSQTHKSGKFMWQDDLKCSPSRAGTYVTVGRVSSPVVYERSPRYTNWPFKAVTEAHGVEYWNNQRWPWAGELPSEPGWCRFESYPGVVALSWPQWFLDGAPAVVNWQKSPVVGQAFEVVQ